MKWDAILRVVGICGVLGAYALFVKAGANVTVLLAVVASIVALISPEAVDALPFGPSK